MAKTPPPPAAETEHPYRVGAEVTQHVVVTTGNDVAGAEIVAYLGIVRGIIVRAMSIGQGFLGGLKSIGGGNIKEYVDVAERARHDAFTQMVEHARQLGADAIIGMRYDATEFQAGTTEVLAYGTAVKLDPRPRP
ncbi:MAG TPA: YbjQ family protein [Kofleriaceae bacterium]|nr:YbjQ family protein [Kofleriaceae bacterium]